MSGEPVARLWRPRLVAYEPLGPLLGELPHPFSWTFTQSDDSRPTLDVHYPLEGAHSEWIKGGCELAVEYPTWGGGDDDRATWVEPINARMVALDKDRDRMDRVETFRYSYIGIDYLLDRAWIQERDPQDPALGDQKAERTFPDPPATAYFGKVIKKLWDEVATATGWGGVGADALDTNFTNTNDTDGTPWSIEVPMVVGLDEPLSNVVKRYVEAGAATPNWHGRTMRAFDGILLEDLTHSVVLRDSDFVSRAPQVVDWQPVATHCRIIGAKGRTWDFERPGDPEQPHGTPEMIMRQYTDCESEERAQRYADQAFAESVIVEQLSAEINFGASRIKPWQDYNLWSKVRRDRGRLSDESKTIDTVGRTVRSISVTVDGQGVRGHVILGDHRRRLGERAARQLAEMGRGSRVGPGGLSLPPGDDPRKPDTPTNIVATPTLFLNQAGRSRVQFAVTVTAPETTSDTDSGLSEAIDLDSVALFHRSGPTGQQRRVLSWDSPTATVLVNNNGAGFDPDVTHHFWARSFSHAGVRSALSADYTATQASDVDPTRGVSLVRDAGHESAVIKAARIADAGGSGLAFVSGIAQLTSTVTLNYGVAETPTAGRAQVVAGEQYIVKIKSRMLLGGTGTVQPRIRWFDVTGATISTTNVFTQALTTTIATYTGYATAPVGAVRAELRVGATAVSGTMQVSEPVLQRQVYRDLVEDAAITGGTGTGAKIANRTISAINVVVDSLTANEIAANTITANEIAAGTITANELAADSVTAVQITSDAIDGMTMNGVTINSATVSAIVVNTASLNTTNMNIAGSTLDPVVGTGILSGNWEVTGTWTESSLRKGKAALEPVKAQDAVRLIRELAAEAVTYRKARDTGGRRQFGFVAENLHKRGHTELVGLNDDGAIAGVNYSRVVTPLTVVSARHEDLIAEQAALIADLRARVERLERSA